MAVTILLPGTLLEIGEYSRGDSVSPGDGPAVRISVGPGHQCLVPMPRDRFDQLVAGMGPDAPVQLANGPAPAPSAAPVLAILSDRGSRLEQPCEAAFQASLVRVEGRTVCELASLDGATGTLLAGAELLHVFAALAHTLAQDLALPPQVRDLARGVHEQVGALVGMRSQARGAKG